MTFEAPKGSNRQLSYDNVRPSEIPTTTDFLFNSDSPAFIPRDAHVLVVGPGIDYAFQPPLPMDRSLLVLPSYLQKGSITILDVPDDFEGEELYGSHNMELVKNGLSYLNRFSIEPFCKINFKQGFLLDEETKLLGKYDCISDHLTTTDWLASQRTDLQQAKIARLIAELYFILLTENGKVILHYSNKKDAPIFEQAFKGVCMETTNINPIRDLYTLPETLVKGLSDNKKFQKHILFPEYQIFPKWFSQGIIVAKKT